MNGAALRSDWSHGTEATPTGAGCRPRRARIGGRSSIHKPEEQRSGRPGRAGPGPRRARGGSAGGSVWAGTAGTEGPLRTAPEPSGASVPGAPPGRGCRAHSRLAFQVLAAAARPRLSRAGAPPPLPDRGSAAAAGLGRPRCPADARGARVAPQEDEGVPGPAGAVHFPAGEWRLRGSRAGSDSPAAPL